MFFHHDSIAPVQEMVTKLYRWIVEIKMKAKLEGGYGLSKGMGSREVGSGEGAIAPPPLYTPGRIWHSSWCDPIARMSVV